MPCHVVKIFLMNKVLLSTRMHSSRMRVFRCSGRLAGGRGRVSAWGGGVRLKGVDCPGEPSLGPEADTSPPVDRLTDARENITCQMIMEHQHHTNHNANTHDVTLIFL